MFAKVVIGLLVKTMLSPLVSVRKYFRVVYRWFTYILTGEKVVPNAQEGQISASPFVAGVVMFGRGREQPGVLVEPNPTHTIDTNDEQALSEYRNKIW